MHGTIGLHGYTLVSPQTFCENMERRWTEHFKQCCNPKLSQLWTVLAKTFGHAITTTALNHPPRWLFVPMPTGTGKSEGTYLYSAIQADLNRDAADHVKPVGILIVTRLTKEADNAAKKINAIAGREVAVADHSELRATPSQISAADVLVVTHAAYVNAGRNVGLDDETSWDKLVTWRGGKRLLTIIDEALLNVVEHNQVRLSALKIVMSLIPTEARSALQNEVAALTWLLRQLESASADLPDNERNSTRVLWCAESGPGAISLASLRTLMKTLPYDELVPGRRGEDVRSRLARDYDEVLRQAEAVLAQFAYYHRAGNHHMLNSALWLIPPGLPGPVVLDATARTNPIRFLLEDKVRLITIPDGARNYRSVTLHVARTRAQSGVGKGSMVKHTTPRVTRLLDALEKELGPDRQVFICTQQDVEPTLRGYKNHFRNLSVGHWGAVDGSNGWAECDTAVIFGIPYLNPITLTNTFFAIQGPRDNAWLEAGSWRDYVDVRRVMQQRHLSTSIIQAINRVRCRCVIDEQGGCAPADIYLILPSGGEGAAILADIESDMPGIKVVDWDFDLDGPKVRRSRANSVEHLVVEFMRGRRPGDEVSLARIRRDILKTDRQLKRLQENLNKETHATKKALREMGVEYVTRGAGRGAKSYLVKHAPN